MRLSDLEAHNAEVQRMAQQEPLADMANLLPHAKAHPFYGFVEVQVPNVEPFVMYSNNDDAVALQAVWQRPFMYEPHSLQLWARACVKARAIADIGAYTGLFSLVAAASNRRAKVRAFEAVDFIFARAFMNAMVNQFHNIKVEHVALSDQEGRTEIHLRFGPTMFSSGSSILEPAKKLAGSFDKLVPTQKADVLLGDLSVDLCKIDVEGAEPMVLRGMEQLLRRDKPLLLMEVLKPGELDKLRTILEPYGYDHRFISEEDAALHQDAGRFWASRESRNLLFAHSKGHIRLRELGWR